VICASAGNHAQGVALAAQKLGAQATIVMPVTTPRIKVSAVAARGAKVELHGDSYHEANQHARALARKHGMTFVHPYDDPLVIAGQGTIGLEILEAAAVLGVVPDAVLIPCGGGGLSAGIALALRTQLPAVEIVIVEPEGFDDYGRSLREDRVVTNAARAGSICDALLAPMPGGLGLSLNRRNLSGGVAVSDDEALAAVAFAFRELKLVVEPGGAVALAALLSGRFPAGGGDVIAVLSGGNIDESLLARALAIDPPTR
jgi:threonine dehydratase